MFFVFKCYLKLPLALFGVLCLAGCPRPASVPKKAPPLAEGKLPTITVIAGGKESYWNEAKRGALAAGKEFNANIIWKAPSGKNEEELLKSQQKLMENAIKVSQGVVCAPIDSTKMMRFFRMVALAGLPVVAYNRDVYTVQNKLTFVHNDDYQTGVLAAGQITQYLESNGEVAIFRTNTEPEIEERIRGFESILRKQIPNYRIINIASNAQKTKADVAFIPDENVIWDGTNFLGSYNSPVVVFKNSSSWQGLPQSEVAALISPDFYQMAYQSVKAILDFRSLNYPPREIKIAPLVITKEKAKAETQN